MSAHVHSQCKSILFLVTLITFFNVDLMLTSSEKLYRLVNCLNVLLIPFLCENINRNILFHCHVQHFELKNDRDPHLTNTGPAVSG